MDRMLSDIGNSRVSELLGEATRLHRAITGPTSQRRDEPEIRLSRLFVDLAHGGNAHPQDKEACQEYARRAGIGNPDPQRPIIPWSVFRGDLTAGVASAGGYLVSSETQTARDILRPWSVSVRAGITVQDGLVGDQAIPRTTAKATPYWLSTEATQAAASTPGVSQVALTPKTAGAVVAFSRQLSRQASAETFTRRELLRTAGGAIDTAILAGSGASGQPTGIINTAGIGGVTGTSLSHAGVSEMKRKVSDANAPDEQIAFITTPSVRELLETRERASGSGYVWQDDKIASRPGYATTDMPSSSMIAGSWPEVYLALWGPGLQIEINPFDPAAFRSGVIQARVLVSCDVGILSPGAFALATSIT